MANKRAYRILTLLLALCLLLPCFSLGAAALEPAYTIGNPYASVDWDAWGQYKTQLHCHTNISDGSVPLNEQIETHYSLDYDILCVTDHMTTGVPWDEAPRALPLMRLVKNSRTKMLPIAPLTSERRQEIITGTGLTAEGRARGPMLEVTRGNELNGAVPSNSHLQGFFTDFGQNKIGVDCDWLTPVKKVHATGGLTVINHPGDVNKAYDDADPLTFFDRNPQWVDKFAYLFVNYDSCVGIDINSGTDYKTKYDKILYDRILAKTIPYGVLPWSFVYSDAHSPGEFDRAWTVHLMPEMTVPALRKSMEDGTFFGFSRYPRLEVGDDFVGVGDPPKISRIAVDQAAGEITITASNYDSITWISNGKIVAQGATLNLAAHGENIGSYVRAYLLGDGGILYVQPFTVLRAGQVLVKEEIKNPFDRSVPLRFLSDAMELVMKLFPPLKWFWQLISWYDPAIDTPWLAENLFDPFWGMMFGD